MQSQNYDVLAENARSEHTDNGICLYKSSFTDPGEVTYVWRERPQSLSEILIDNSLPIVVKLFQENIINGSDTPVDLQRPLLLYKEVKGKKLHARNLKARTAARDDRLVYNTTGPFISIPDTYTGFFRPLEAREQPLQIVADVIRVMPVSFIATSECEGFQCVNTIGEYLYQKVSLQPGLYLPKNVLEEPIPYLNNRKTEKKKLIRCLQCEDEKGKIVLFPFESKGSFFIGELNPKFNKSSNVDSSRRVFKWTELESEATKNRRIKLIHGPAPIEDCGFTGIIELSHVTNEHTVVGCTMTSKPRLFEMTVTTEPFFIAALNSDEVEGGFQQKSTKFAKSESVDYLRKIKVRKDYDIEQTD